MKNIKISSDVHRQIKEISAQEGMTMDGVLRKFLQVEKGEYQKGESAGSNSVGERNTTNSSLVVENGVEKGRSRKEVVTCSFSQWLPEAREVREGEPNANYYFILPHNK